MTATSRLCGVKARIDGTDAQPHGQIMVWCVCGKSTLAVNSKTRPGHWIGPNGPKNRSGKHPQFLVDGSSYDKPKKFLPSKQ